MVREVPSASGMCAPYACLETSPLVQYQVWTHMHRRTDSHKRLGYNLSPRASMERRRYGCGAQEGPASSACSLEALEAFVRDYATGEQAAEVLGSRVLFQVSQVRKHIRHASYAHLKCWTALTPDVLSGHARRGGRHLD